MILTIRHLGNGENGQRFAVVNQEGNMGEETILVAPDALQVKDRPTSNLKWDLRWYLERFLDYPFSPETEVAEEVLATLKGWGSEGFKKLFSSRKAASWYGDAYDVRFQGVTFRVASEDPVILAWPWEALYDEGAGIYPAHQAGFERQIDGKLLDPPPVSKKLSQNSLNILLIIARPGGDADVGYHAVARPLVELAQKDARVRVDLLRPPTFDALRQRLEEKKDFYHVVHFDGHGGDGRSASGGSPFTYEKRSQGLLLFEDEKGQGEVVTAGDLNELLFRHAIPFMVLNACRSGAVDERAEDPFASTAVALMRAGIRGVVAMGYNLYVSGAQEFVPGFYRELFKSGSLALATRAGREAMRASPGRVCGRGTFPLQDWLVPVLYQHDSPRLKFHKQVAPAARMGEIPLSPECQVGGDFGFIGRDRAVLALERALLHQPQGGILLHGMAGIGKTTLAQGLLTWFAQTGGLEHPPLWFSFDTIRSAEYVINRVVETFFGHAATAHPLEKKLGMVVQAMKENRLLVVWDNFESASGVEDSQQVSPLLSPEDRNLLQRLLKALLGGKGKILITSRSPERWLSVTHCFRLPLTGLEGEERWNYCNAVVRLLGLTPDRGDKNFQALMEKLDGHPLAMRAVLLRLNERSAGQLLAELEQGLQGKAGDESTAKIHQALGIFASGLSKDLAPVLRLIGLHQRFVVVGDLEQMAEIAELALPRPRIDACFTALENGGMVHHLGQGLYRMHPALASYLSASYPASHEARRGFATVMAVMADHFAPKPLHEQRSPFQIHKENFHHALTLAPESGVEGAVPDLTQALAFWALNTRDWEGAKRLFLALGEYHGQKGDGKGEAVAYHQLGRVAEEQRAWSDADVWYKKSLEISDRQGNEQDAASTYHQLGVIAEKQRAWPEAEVWYKKSLEISERQGNEQGAALTYHQLGTVSYMQGAWSDAESWYKKSLEIKERQGNEQGAASTYHQLGMVAQEQGAWSDAESWYKKAMEIWERLGIEHHAASTYGQLGTVALKQGAWSDAESWCKKSLEIEERQGNEHGAALTCVTLGNVARSQGEFLSSGKWYLKALLVFLRVSDEYHSKVCQNNMRILLSEVDPTTHEALQKIWRKAGVEIAENP